MSDHGSVRPPFIISTADIAEETGRYPGSSEVLSFGKAIGKAAGLERIGLHVERLPSGHRTSYPHAEGDEEEFVLVLKGTVEAWIDGTLFPMSEGDLAAFPAATGIAHTFLNNSNDEALLLVGGERSKPGNRVFYPLNPERRSQMPEGQWWEDPPAHLLGNHGGKPDPIGR
jgi:uncharacterized cupin superfamily protein